MKTWLLARLWSTEVDLFGLLNSTSWSSDRINWRKPRRLPRLVYRPMRWLAELASEKQVCPRREEGFVPAWSKPPDHWSVHYNGDRTCTFCGSMHVDQFLAVCAEIAEDRLPGAMVEFCKGYKFYVTRPGIRNAMDGAIKFYSQHLRPRRQLLECEVVEQERKINRAIHVSRRRFQERRENPLLGAQLTTVR